MPTINQSIRILPPSVAERIAAGEVIERPTSIVKEAVENSMDAGATEISVALEDGGKTLVEIIDNGSGMAPEDLRICVQRHATSKLSSLEDLDCIDTLGFRGEALPSIAAVSELTLLSRVQGGDSAYELIANSPDVPDRFVAPQPVTFGNFLNSTHGTRLCARGLFSQIPARLKFLKSTGAEVLSVRQCLERLAISRPNVGFRLLSDNKTVLHLRATDESTRIRDLFSEGGDDPVVSSEHETESIRVRVHWFQGISTSQTRKLVQVVNGRTVRDRMIQQALLAPFKQSLLPGNFPAVVAFIDVPTDEIDVNVHPTKTEIRFLNSSSVFRAIGTTVSSMISKKGAPSFVSSSHISAGHISAGLFSSDSMSFDHSSLGTTARDSSSPQNSNPSASASANANSSMPDSIQLVSNLLSEPLHMETPETQIPTQEPMGRTEWGALHEPKLELEPASLYTTIISGKLVGTVFNTYLMYDAGKELILIDQHAAHERIRYEKLRNRIFNKRRIDGETSGENKDIGKLDSQALLIPETIHFPAEARPVVENRLEWVQRLGFEAEVFGENTVLFRAIPPEWGVHGLRMRLKNLLDRLIHEESVPTATLPEASKSRLFMDEALFESLASEACHSSVRAGDALEKIEATELTKKLFSCEYPWNCPHGRPTVVRVPRARLEEWFQRRL